MAFDEKAEGPWWRHLQYDGLVAEPIEAVRRLYVEFGDEVSDLHARRMRAFLDHRPKDAFGRHVYDPADIGWTYPALAEEFKEYSDRYQVRSDIRA
jgi:hypothetical protein